MTVYSGREQDEQFEFRKNERELEDDEYSVSDENEKGNEEYRAPELQYDLTFREKYTTKMDIYSIGAVMGKLIENMEKYGGGVASESLQNLLARAIEPKQDDRISLYEMRERLELIFGDLEQLPKKEVQTTGFPFMPS